MKPSAFRYVRPPDVAAALRALRDDPDAKVIAGGQSLVPMMNLRLARPAALIDIDRMDGLARIFEDVDSLIIGAMVRHRRLERDPLVARRAPLLREAARHIGHVGIRNRGTLGGTLAHADPAAELPLVMVALGATVHVESLERGRREVPAAEFFASLYTTALAEDELVTWVRVPALAPGRGWGFTEFSRRPGDFAMSGAAALVTLSPQGEPTHVRAALMGASDRPLLLPEATPGHGASRPFVSAVPGGGGRGFSAFAGEREMWGEVARVWVDGLGIGDDYVRRLARVALARALRDAHRRALAGREGEGA